MQVLERFPELSFQQFYNELYWHDAPAGRIATRMEALRHEQATKDLWLRTRLPLMVSLDTHRFETRYGIETLAVHDDGRWVSAISNGSSSRTASQRYQICVWDLTKGAIELTMMREGMVTSIGDEMVAIGQHEHFEVWSLKNRSLLGTFTCWFPRIVIPGPEGMSFLSYGQMDDDESKPITEVTLPAHGERRVLAGHARVFHQFIVGYSWHSKHLYLLDAGTWRELGSVAVDHDAEVNAFIYPACIVVTIAGRLSAWDYRTGKLVREFQLGEAFDSVAADRFLITKTPRRTEATSAAKQYLDDFVLRVFDMREQAHALEIECGWSTKHVTAGEFLASSDDDGQVTLHALGKRRDWSVGRLGRIETYCLLPKRQWIVISGTNCCLVWDLANGSEVARFDSPPTRTRTLHSEFAGTVATDPDERFIAMAGWQSGIHILDVGSRRLTRLARDAPQVCQLAFSRGAEVLAAGGEDRSCRVWDMRRLGWMDAGPLHEEPAPVLPAAHDGRIENLTILEPSLSDHLGCISEGGDGWIRWWDLVERRRTRSDRRPETPVVPAATLGTGLVAQAKGRDITFADPTDATRSVRAFSADSYVSCVVAHPTESHVLLSAGHDRVVRSWYLPEVALMSEFATHSGWIENVAVSPSSRRFHRRRPSGVCWRYCRR